MTSTTTKARIFDLGLSEYDKAHQLQLQMVEKRIAGDAQDTFIFTSHPPTITIGRGGGNNNVLVSDDILTQKGVKKYEVERGGDVTFHGPGQQVIYPIVDLEQRGRDLHKFLRDLEEVVIVFLKNYDITGERALRQDRSVGGGQENLCHRYRSETVGELSWVSIEPRYRPQFLSTD